jgi:hypothetical protein
VRPVADLGIRKVVQELTNTPSKRKYFTKRYKNFSLMIEVNKDPREWPDTSDAPINKYGNGNYEDYSPLYVDGWEDEGEEKENDEDATD